MRRYHDSYRILAPGQAIGTISKREYDRYKHKHKTHGNQYVRTLIVGYGVYQVIRDEYKRNSEARV